LEAVRHEIMPIAAATRTFGGKFLGSGRRIDNLGAFSIEDGLFG
jgi:hypothetical protein